MQSQFKRIESSFIINVHLSAYTMSTPELGIEDDPYFRTNHAKQMVEALNLLVKRCELKRVVWKVWHEGEMKPFYIHKTNHQLFYRDPIIKAFFEFWVKLDVVDRTFHLIDSEKQYGEELAMQSMHDMYYLDDWLQE